MTDLMTRKPLIVSDARTPWPSIRLAYSQVPEVRQILDDHKVRFWVEENVISFDGWPEIAYIQLGRGTDAATVQAILDSVR